MDVIERKHSSSSLFFFLLADMRYGRVPEEFPGCVLVDDKPDDNRNHLKATH